MPCIIGVGLASYVMECFVFLLEALMQETYVMLRAVALAPHSAAYSSVDC